MAYKLECPETELLTIENVRNDDSSFGNVQSDLEKVEVLHGPPVDLAQIDDFHTATAANDLLQNGILVETNKGLVCMSLKDVLSSNLNLSEEDFHKVAAQLLLQQNLSSSDVTSDNTDTNDQQNENTNLNLPKPVTTTTVPSQNDVKESMPISIEISYKSNVASSSDESTNLTHISDNLSIENIDQQMNPQKISTPSIKLENNESQPFLSSTNLFELDKSKDKAMSVTKRRGGWPKGRKRKPELVNLPPKAPKTSYNIFLNERRKLYKDKLAFHEITRVVGNQWSSLSAEEKQPYIEKALEDKMRYRQELMAYRQSDAYKLYLARKRKKRAMDNLYSESDMDGTDDFDDEPDDLYCDMCDQWFYNLHNKREHLLSRQHKMLVADDMTRELASSDSEYRGHISSVSFSTSLDESSLDAAPIETVTSSSQNKFVGPETVSDFMSNLLGTVIQREKEIQILQMGLNKAVAKKTSFMLELSSLKEKANELRAELSNFKKHNIVIETQIYQLWQTIFLVNNAESEKKSC